MSDKLVELVSKVDFLIVIAAKIGSPCAALGKCRCMQNRGTKMASIFLARYSLVTSFAVGSGGIRS